MSIDATRSYPSENITWSNDLTSCVFSRLVEDNLVNAKLGQRMLITLGYDVLLAYNGLEAFEAVKMGHSSIQAVLMDCQASRSSSCSSVNLATNALCDL